MSIGNTATSLVGWANVGMALAADRVARYDFLLNGASAGVKTFSKALGQKAYAVSVMFNVAGASVAAYEGDYNEFLFSGVSAATSSYAYFGGLPGLATSATYEYFDMILFSKLRSAEGIAAVASTAGPFP